MTGVRYVLACVVALTACDVPRPLAPIRVAIHLPLARFRLPNGLEVVVQEDHRTPHVAVNVRYHAGSKNDPQGRAGMAHLVEHLQFTESAHTTLDSFFLTVNALGAENVNGETGLDYTSYYETVPSGSLEAALWLEADRMASARLGWTDASIAREKNVVGQELRLRYRNEPNGFRYQLLTRAVYPTGHPYRLSLDEEAQERASTPTELREFATHHYGPDNATLMLVGDVTPDHAKEIVTKYFGAVAPCVARPLPRTIAPVERAAYKRVNVIADVDEVMIYIAWPLPAPTDDGYYEAGYALTNLEAFAASSAEDDHAAMRKRSTGRGILSNRLGSIGYIVSTPTKGSSPDALVDAVRISRTRLVAHEWGVLSAYRSQYIAEQIRDTESISARAASMQRYLALYGEPDYVMRDLKAVQLVTQPRMTAAIDTLFDLDRAVVVVVTPNPSAARAGTVVSEVPR